jgi:hypothetical protein
MPSPERSLGLGVEILADDALGRAFARLNQYPTKASNALREAICDFVDRAKARGESPERVIIALKTIAHRSGVAAWRTPTTSGVNGNYDALTDAVTWCIERYYEGSDNRPESKLNPRPARKPERSAEHTSERDRPA